MAARRQTCSAVSVRLRYRIDSPAFDGKWANFSWKGEQRGEQDGRGFNHSSGASSRAAQEDACRPDDNAGTPNPDKHQ